MLGLLLTCTLVTPAHDLLAELLASRPEFEAIVASAEEHRLQILLTEVHRREDGVLQRRRHGYRVDAEYFYPASAIKTCAAVAAVKYAQDWHAPVSAGLSFPPLFPDEVLEELDPSNLEGGKITISHEIRKLFLVSDNRAFNRLYELVGPSSLQRVMWEAGISPTIRHRLSEYRSPQDQLRTPLVMMILPDGGRLGTGDDAAEYISRDLSGMPGIQAGKAHMRDGVLIEEPFSFMLKNYMSVLELQEMNMLLLRPDLTNHRPGFDLTEKNRAFLIEAMGQYASESENPLYDAKEYPDDWGRFILAGVERVLPKDHFRIHDKIGRAYGFSIENAYVTDDRTETCYFLTAVIYTNANGVVNDGVYEYEEIADPFFVTLGEVVTRHVFGE